MLFHWPFLGDGIFTVSESWDGLGSSLEYNKLLRSSIFFFCLWVCVEDVTGIQ